MLARRLLNSYDDFWRQFQWSTSYGPRQTEWHVSLEPCALKAVVAISCRLCSHTCVTHTVLSSGVQGLNLTGSDACYLSAF